MEWTIATVCSLGLGVALYFFAGEHLWLAIPAAIVLFFAIILTMRYFARRSR
jgi:membrane protein YdbS with pleckstrin-like domain